MGTLMNILFVTFFVALLTPFVLCLIDRKYKTHMSCTYFGWHNGDGDNNHGFDGMSWTSTCSKCGANVMQDSQGNWF